MNEILLQELLSELSNVSSELKDISGELAEMNKIADIVNRQQVILLNGIEASLRRRNLLYSYVHNIDPNRSGLQL